MAPNGELARVKPIFILTRDLPFDPEDFVTTREICAKAEDLCGYGTMEGAQRIGGLWRVYPKTQAARMQLLISGIAIRNVHVRFHDENPFLLRDKNSQGGSVETTKLMISNIPISFANNELEEKLVSMGCQMASKLMDECDRDKAGKLTRWKTGRRFVFIAVPTTPLPTQINIGPFIARLFHREQKNTNSMVCGNCLQSGHRKHECKADIVCRRCHKSGHKSGDELCNHAADAREATPVVPKPDVMIATTASGLETASIEHESDDEEGETDDGDSSSSESTSLKDSKKRKRPSKSSDVSDDNAERDTKAVNVQPSPGSLMKPATVQQQGDDCT
jgi:hypothetical protein